MPEPIRNNQIEEYFWTVLTQGGLDLVDGGRVDTLIDHLKKHKAAGDAAPTAPMTATPDALDVDAYEREALKKLLHDESWRRLLTDDGVRKLETFLEIQTGAHRAGQGKDVPGTVPVGSVPNNLSTLIGQRGLKLQHLPALFNHEYEQRKADLFENPSLAEEERARNLFFLLQDYAKVINAVADGPAVAELRRQLLEVYFSKPLAAKVGAQDPDDDLLVSAWEVVWGTDPEKHQSDMPVDHARQWSSYMSMNGDFVEVAKKLDAFLSDAGKPANIYKYEKRSPLNWIVREPTGNVKPSSTFDEQRALSSTGVDFAIKLLADEGTVGERTLDPALDLKVDFYAWSEFVVLDKSRGDRLVAIHDDTQAELKVEAELYSDQNWRPIFKDAEGNVVDRAKVTCVVKDARGTIKGDGKATGSYSASWWGFCDRNAMLGLVTMKYGFAKPTKDVTLTAAGKEHKFTAEEIIKIVGRRLTEIFPQHNQAGNRFDDEPDQIHLQSGTTLQGKIKSPVDFYRPDTYRQGDLMVVTPQDKDAPRGSLVLKLDDGSTRELETSEITELRRTPQSGADARTGADAKDTAVLKDGTEVHGKLESKVSFSKAEKLTDGTLVLKNSAEKPLLGEIKLTTTRGEEKRVPISDIRYLVHEDENEVLADEALAYIIRNRGVFCADSWTGSSVANGTRTIEAINRWKAGEADRPAWVPEEMAKLKGYRGPVKDPTKLTFFSLGDKGGSYYGGLKFWFEVDENGIPKNLGMLSGQWDFLWGVEGKPDWNADATMNPNLPNDLVLRLYINSLENPEACAGVLPDDWRSYLLPAPPAPPAAPSTPPPA
jgi:hypothetical protein